MSQSETACNRWTSSVQAEWIQETSIKLSKAMRARYGPRTKCTGFTVPLTFTGLVLKSVRATRSLSTTMCFYCSVWKLLCHHSSQIIKKKREKPQVKRTQTKHEILEVCPVFLILLIKCSNAFGKLPKSMVCGKHENNWVVMCGFFHM